VDKLRVAVAKHLPERYVFVCLTDVDLRQPEVFDAPLRHEWPSWWGKIELFRPDIFPRGESVLYFDLDTVVVGSLADLGKIVRKLAKGKMLGLRDFYRPDVFASGLMAWKAGSLNSVYNQFVKNPIKAMESCRRKRDSRSWGDGAWIGSRIPSRPQFWQDVAPGQVVSYKVHCGTGLPDKAAVVCFHGVPKPDRAAPWVRRFW
jgi:hypothetical protein